MFDFLKKKSYTVTQEKGMQKLVTAADMKKAAEDALKALESLPENYIKDLIEYLKSSIEHENISKEFLKMIEKIVDAVSTKKAKEVQKSMNAETPAPKQEKKEEPAPKKEEKPKEDINNIIDLGGDLKEDNKQELGKAASIEKDSIVRVAVDTNPASSKYRAEGIKEKLLEINKEVAVKSDNKVQNIGNNTKGIITPGDKSTVVKVKEETVKPDMVVENVKIKIIRDEGEFEKLFPEKNIKFPTGDKVVIKANNEFVINTEKFKTAPKSAQDKVKNALDTEDTSQIDQALQETGIGTPANTNNTNSEMKTSTGSIYNQVMQTVFNRSAEAEVEDENRQKFKEELEADIAEILK